jgi:hypothetical protein
VIISNVSEGILLNTRRFRVVPPQAGTMVTTHIIATDPAILSILELLLTDLVRQGIFGTHSMLQKIVHISIGFLNAISKALGFSHTA